MQSVTIFEVCYNIPTEQKLFDLKVVADIQVFLQIQMYVGKHVI